MKQELLDWESKYGMIYVDGKYYRMSHKDGKPVLVREDEGNVNERLKKAEKIADKLKDKLDAKAVLTETLMTRYTRKDIDKLYTMLFKSKKKYTIKTRQQHCVDMKIGNMILPIVD